MEMTKKARTPWVKVQENVMKIREEYWETQHAYKQNQINSNINRFLMTLFHDSLFALMLLNTHNLTSFFKSHELYKSMCLTSISSTN